MTRSEKIKLLSRYKTLKINHDLVLQAHLEHRSKMLSIQAQIITDMPVARNCNKDKVMKMYIRDDSMRYKLADLHEKMHDAREQAQRMISSATGKKKDVLTHRYILCMSWTQICDKMQLSSVHVRRMHDEGVEEI